MTKNTNRVRYLYMWAARVDRHPDGEGFFIYAPEVPGAGEHRAYYEVREQWIDPKDEIGKASASEKAMFLLMIAHAKWPSIASSN